MKNAKKRKTEIIEVTAMKNIIFGKYCTWDNDTTAESIALSDGIDYADKKYQQEKGCVEKISREEMIAEWEEQEKFDGMTEKEKIKEIEERTRELSFPEDFVFEDILIKVTFDSHGIKWESKEFEYCDWEEAKKYGEKGEFEFVKYW